ncbi:hypothetical protein M3Y98_00805200 [Aphelenchoides besseyi]|nr:hypothetical protein M3Y98_00805200 [Aphelenchoides besseyi]
MMDRFGSAFQLPQPGDVTELDTRSNQHLDRGYSVCIDKTWDNKPIEDHDPISIQMNWLFQKMDGEPHKRAIRVQITATLFDDPEAPNDFLWTVFRPLQLRVCRVVFYERARTIFGSGTWTSWSLVGTFARELPKMLQQRRGN